MIIDGCRCHAFRHYFRPMYWSKNPLPFSCWHLSTTESARKFVSKLKSDQFQSPRCWWSLDLHRWERNLRLGWRQGSRRHIKIENLFFAWNHLQKYLSVTISFPELTFASKPVVVFSEDKDSMHIYNTSVAGSMPLISRFLLQLDPSL